MTSTTGRSRTVLPDTGGNPATWILYRIAYPLAWIAHRGGISANVVSLLSFLAASGAVVALVSVDSALGFSVLWASSVILDFADGTVARMSGQVNKSAFRLDHTLDLVKLVIGTTGLAFFWDSSILWVLALCTTSSVFLFTLLNHDLAYATTVHGHQPTRQRMSRTTWRRTFVLPIFTIHGGSILLLSLASIGETLAYSVLTYLLVVSITLLIRNAFRLRDLPKF